MNIPRERDITRQQLWRRDDRTVEIIHNKALEIYTAIEQIKLHVDNRLVEVFQENQLSMEKHRDQLVGKYTADKKELQRAMDKSTADLVKTIQDKTKNFDTRFNQLLDTVSKTIYIQIEERMGHLSEMTKKIVKSTEQYSKETKTQIARLEMEHKKKMGEINKKLDTVSKKFKLISSELS